MEEKKAYKVPENDSERIVALEAELAKYKRNAISINELNRAMEEIMSLRNQVKLLSSDFECSTLEVERLRKILFEKQSELNSQIDGTSRLVQDCDAWREKYRELKAQYDDLEAKYHTIEASNCHMETELYRVKATRDELSKKCSEALADNKRMHNQSLLDRIFNR